MAAEGSPGDVSTDIVGIAQLELGGPEAAAGEHQVAKPSSEALDLPLDGIGEVARPAVGNVAVGPQRVLPLRRPGVVEQAGLSGDEKGGLRHGAAGRRLQRGGDLPVRPAEVNAARAPAAFVSPGDGTVQ